MYRTLFLASIIVFVFAFILTARVPHAPRAESRPTRDTPIPKPDKLLTKAINKHRRKLNLPRIKRSRKAWLTAATHNWDITANNPVHGECSAHSWSSQQEWKGCCYQISNPDGACMWSKPKEIAGAQSLGYEIGSSGGNLAPDSALQMWLGSEPHKAVIENTGMWANKKWTGIGCSLMFNGGCCWFLD